jgi:hypothetical protein
VKAVSNTWRKTELKKAKNLERKIEVSKKWVEIASNTYTWFRTQVKSDDRAFYCKIEKVGNRVHCEEIRLKDGKKSRKYLSCLKIGLGLHSKCLQDTNKIAEKQ